jgi:hypothetical protein
MVCGVSRLKPATLGNAARAHGPMTIKRSTSLDMEFSVANALGTCVATTRSSICSSFSLPVMVFKDASGAGCDRFEEEVASNVVQLGNSVGYLLFAERWGV